MSDWVPTREAWDKFLLLLDDDREAAGEKYENIRRRLIFYFECRKRYEAEDLADETITRVIKRCDEGIHIDDVMRYCYGVARIVFLETLVAVRRMDSVLQELIRFSSPFNPPDDTDELHILTVTFDECMDKLSIENRRFILTYYDDSGRAKIDKRKSLTEKLGVSRNAVTLRAFQIRKKLERCIKSHLRNRAA
ncbi:MAG TPA: sigma-70 family RNA polymerase sigma factor [Pyrinomonadaceae bacterium]